MTDSDHELVLAVPRRHVLGTSTWHGVRTAHVAHVLELVARHGRYIPRDEAEDDPAWKQIIPYLLLRDRGRLFLMKRTRAGADARLHERWSIGIGGHLNPEDGDVEQGLLREFEEELVADWRPQPSLLGLLNDDSTAVGRVHLGIVFEAEAAGRAVAVRETHKLSGAFAEPTQVAQGYARLETWSQLLYDHVTKRTAAGVGRV